MTSLRSTVLAVAAAILCALATNTLAQDKHGHGKEEKHFKVTPPADIKAAWASITTTLAEAGKLLAEKKVEPIHEISEHLEAAVHVLEKKSDMVPGEKKSRLTSALKQFDKAVDGLHHGAEEKDAAQVGVELKKIQGLLPLVEAQFPAGVLK